MGEEKCNETLKGFQRRDIYSETFREIQEEERGAALLALIKIVKNGRRRNPLLNLRGLVTALSYP